MSASVVGLIGVLFAAGTWLVLHRTLTRIVLGVGLLANGVNLLIVETSSRPGEVPIVGRDGDFTDPLPQALVLTAIVIGFALTAFLAALAWRSAVDDGDDEVEDDVEDRMLGVSTSLVDGRSDSPDHEDVASDDSGATR
ncbi:MAG: sodium:proton antiporter [Ilumatobacteraceae bacterium]